MALVVMEAGGGILEPLLLTPTANLGTNGGARPPETRRAGGHGPTLADQVVYRPQPRETAKA